MSVVKPTNRDSDHLQFIVLEQEHASYTREADNLKYTAVVNPRQFLLGCELEVPLLDERKKKVAYGGILGYGRIICRGLGMPSAEREGRRGDLIISASLLPPEALKTGKSILKMIVAFFVVMLVYNNP